MSKKIILAFFLIVVCSIGYIQNAFAYDLASEYDPNNIINAPYFNGNVFYFGITSQNVDKYVMYVYTHGNSMGSRTQIDTETKYATTYFTGFGVSCPGYYTVNLFDGSNNVGRVQFEVWENEFSNIDSCADSSPIEPTDPPEEPEEPTDPPEEPEEPTDPPEEPEEPVDPNPGPIDPYDPETDCMYNPDLPLCQEGTGESPPEESDDPYDRDGNGINDYIDQDWDDPNTVIPYCDQTIPGTTDEHFGDHPSIPCEEADEEWGSLPECDPQFIDWEPCREPGEIPPWEEPYPEFPEEQEEPEAEECTICSVFECPGWGEYMGFLEGLADDIVGDVEVPEVPTFEQPEMPNIFDVLNRVDQRNDVQKPTGQEDPNLGNSSFNADDIKNNAPEIEFRDDPSGGFNIVNPLETLPEDGSTAPRPQEELESLPYPGGSPPTEGEEEPRTPTPSNENDGTVMPPSNPGGTATPPTNSSGTAQQPTYSDTVNYPTP